MTAADIPSKNTQNLIEDFSLEMTGKDVQALHEASEFIPQGTKINVTFLGNEDLEMRIAAAKAVRDLGFRPVPHISARRLESGAQLEEFLDRLQQVGASDHIFSVGGDPEKPQGPFPDSLTVIESELLAKYGVKNVSIAGYPEGHPDISDEVLWSFLKNKETVLKERGMGCTLITQFGFDAQLMTDWVTKVREAGIDSQIRIGTPGPATIKRLLSFARRFGVGANTMIAKKYGFSLMNLVGTAGPEKFVSALEDAQAKNPVLGDLKLHFYAFGGLAATAKWVDKYGATQHGKRA